jgi:hypothetical protein
VFCFSANAKDLNPKDLVRLELAKQKLFAGKYVSALNEFKEILKDNPEDGTALYYCGNCHFQLKEYDKALDFLTKSRDSKNPSVHASFLLGRIMLYNAKPDEALTEFNNFKAKASKSEISENDVELYISHCNNFKESVSKAADVSVENMGNSINSQYDDKGPSISADGKKLVFNSRRPETTDSPMDVEGDGKYFEDIYISNYDTSAKKWSDAEQVPGQVNTAAHDACTGISADGKMIFIYKNDLTDPESRGGDVFISKVVNNKWKTPEPIGKPINTSFWEGGACISPDGKTLFFTSERKGGLGNSDIWVVKRINKNEWGKPENLGAEINTPFDEAGIFLAPDGKTLFYCSNGPASTGSYDIFRTINENGKWTKPERLAYPINTERRDGPLVIAADGKKAYISSDRKESIGENDVFAIDLKEYALLEKDFKRKNNNGLSILKGIIRDGFEGKGLEGVEVSILSDTGEKLTSTTTNDHGEYFFTLKGNAKYELKAEKNGYKTNSEKVDLPLGKNNDTFTLEKQMLLNK